MCSVEIYFYQKITESNINETKSQECYISSQDTLKSFKEIQ